MLILIRYILDNIKLVSRDLGNGRSTPFLRLKSLASLLYKGASAASLKRSAVTKKGSTIHVSQLGSDPVPIDLYKWAFALVDIMGKYQEFIKALLPSDILLTLFPFDQLTDNFSRAAIFKQPHNAALLDPLRERIRIRIFEHFGLFGTDGIDIKACIGWLDATQLALKQLAVLFAMTSGICPPQHEYRVYHDSTASETRGVWLLPNKIVIWSNRMARPKDTDLLPAVYMIPSPISSTLLFDLTILRPIACQIMRSLARDDSPYATEIFTHYRRQPHGKYYWTGPEISAPVQQYTSSALGVSLDPNSIRSLLYSTFRHFFEGQVMQVHGSIVDKAAQHVSATSLAHYGRLATFPPFKHMRFDQPLRFVNLNHIWLSILHVEPPSIAWRGTLTALGLVIYCPWSSEGLQYARVAIRRYGDLSNPAIVHSALSRLPYLYGPTVGHLFFVPSRDFLADLLPKATTKSRTEPWEVLGDEVLVEVTKFILADLIHQPNSLSTRCDARLVTYAMSLVSPLLRH